MTDYKSVFLDTINTAQDMAETLIEFTQWEFSLEYAVKCEEFIQMLEELRAEVEENVE